METITRMHYDLIMIVKNQTFNKEPDRDKVLNKYLTDWISKYYGLDTDYIQDHYRIIKRTVLDILEKYEEKNKGSRFIIADRIETETLNNFYSREGELKRDNKYLTIYDYFLINYLSELTFMLMIVDEQPRFKIVNE